MFIISVLFQNCCYNGLRNKYDLPRSNNKDLNNKLNKNIFSAIDTTCFYENIGYYRNSKIFLEKDFSRGKIFIKFYNNGKIAKFIGVGFNQKLYTATTNYKILHDDFDASKAYMGYYSLKNNVITANQFLNNQCQMFWVESIIDVRKDTLIQKYKRFYDNAVYVRRLLPKEFLIYKPDW